MKKIITFGTMMLLIASLTLQCSKPKDGIDGKNGKDGTNGAPGAQGPQGTPGNAGVMMYTYGERTFPTFQNYIFPVTLAEASKSLIYAYFQPSELGAWFCAPGRCDTYYEVTTSINDERIAVRLINITTGADYNTPVTWSGFRIIVVPIPDSNITTLATAPATASKGAAVDYSNYAEVAKYYGLPQ